MSLVGLQLLLVLVVLSGLISAAWAGVSFAPWLPSHTGAVYEGLRLAHLAPGERFVDLGCGDGRVLLLAATAFGAQATGVELSWPVWLASQARIAIARVRRQIPPHQVTTRLGSLFAHPLEDTHVVFVYGMNATLGGRLRTKLERDLPAGARVISYGFPLPGLTPRLVRDGTSGLLIYPTAPIPPSRAGLTGPQTLYIYDWPPRESAERAGPAPEPRLGRSPLV